MHIEEQSAGALRFWLGDCCERCADAWQVTFIHPRVDGLEDDTDLDHPLLRLASAQECLERGLSVPEGSTAYCIVTNYGNGPDGQRVLVVADGIDGYVDVDTEVEAAARGVHCATQPVARDQSNAVSRTSR